MKRHLIMSLLAITVASTSVRADAASSVATGGSVPPRVLLIVAHPDDEYEMAATVYKIARDLAGVVDQVIISDGEGGFRYSTLAGQYYGIDLTNEQIGRAQLPHIRKDEARRAARVLGIQHQWFLNERDEHFTLDANEVLQKSWNSNRVEQRLVQRLRQGRYDVVLVLLPTEDTHGEHKAASILALEAVARLPENQRPAILAAEASDKNPSYSTLPGYPATATYSSLPQFRFDRDIHFGFRNSLSYQIVVNWVIAEHKSQGLFQTTIGQDRYESFWVFRVSSESANEKATALFSRLSGTPGLLEPTVAATVK
jgi:LmbE family N-acetylglucosaminyl deacetylase